MHPARRNGRGDCACPHSLFLVLCRGSLTGTSVAPAAGSGPLDPERRSGMSTSPMRHLVSALRQNGLIRFIEHFAELFPTSHLKDLVVDRIGPNRIIEVAGRTVVNFGSDSFLGLDQDP